MKEAVETMIGNITANFNNILEDSKVRKGETWEQYVRRMEDSIDSLH